MKNFNILFQCDLQIKQGLWMIYQDGGILKDLVIFQDKSIKSREIRSHKKKWIKK